jgi:hypothetical protein
VAITTTDVVTNVVPGNEVIKNASCVVYCFNTGNYGSVQSTFQGSFTYDELEDKYTSRFDNISYYNAVDGGGP